MCRRLPLLGIFLASLVVCSPSGSVAATLPVGFAEVVAASGLTNPTAMQFAPDGRLFVCEQGGALRVVKNGQLLAAPFVSLSVDASGERGLLGVAFDPNFSVNRFVYVYYTTASSPVHNRISRFTANGDVAAAGSEVAILDLEPLSTAVLHNGGAINFAADGTLFVAVGDNADGANAQSFSTRLGKMLRINPDGSIPTDNPFYNTASGPNRAIWARGLRNPFTFALNPGGPPPTMIINDVGQEAWEEINDGEPGANYGWPMAEGLTYDPALNSPRYAYDHSGGACAITGGAFYAPATPTFPSAYVNAYFFADFCLGVIRRLDLATNSVHDFAAGISYPVDLKVGPDGALYYLARDAGLVVGVQYVSDLPPPSILTQPASVTVSPGEAANFSVVPGGTGPFSFQWQRNGSDITGATAASYGIASAQPADSGSTFRVRVANVAGSLLSQPAVLTVATNLAPTATIVQPATGASYSGGDTIAFAGSGIDPEEGPLPAGAFTWHIDFHHDTHSHPFLAATSGITAGSFVVPVIGETSANVWFRVSLTVRDSAGRTHTVQRDLHPRVVRLTLDTSPPGLQLRLDGQPVVAPHAFDSVVGMRRTIGAPDQTAAGADLAFVGWSERRDQGSHRADAVVERHLHRAVPHRVRTRAAPGAGAVHHGREWRVGAHRLEPRARCDVVSPRGWHDPGRGRPRQRGCRRRRHPRDHGAARHVLRADPRREQPRCQCPLERSQRHGFQQRVVRPAAARARRLHGRNRGPPRAAVVVGVAVGHRLPAGGRVGTGALQSADLLAGSGHDVCRDGAPRHLLHPGARRQRVRCQRAVGRGGRAI